MKRSTLALIAAAIGAALAGAPYAQSQIFPPGVGQGTIQRHDMPSPSDTPATKAFKEAHIKMVNRHIMFVGNPDVDFVRMMIPHYQDAVDLAKIELTFGKDHGLRALAEKMVLDMDKHLTELEAWLKRNTNR